MKRTLGMRIGRKNRLAGRGDDLCRDSRARGRAGQDYANSVIAGFEIAPAGSLEAEMLGRLSVTGQYRPEDLPRLARLTVLESIAMYENFAVRLSRDQHGGPDRGGDEPVVGCGRALLCQLELSTSRPGRAEPIEGPAGRRRCRLPADRFVAPRVRRPLDA